MGNYVQSWAFKKNCHDCTLLAKLNILYSKNSCLMLNKLPINSAGCDRVGVGLWVLVGANSTVYGLKIDQS